MRGKDNPGLSLRPMRDHGTMGLQRIQKGAANTMLMKTESQPVVIGAEQKLVPLNRPSRVRFAMAFGVAAISDVASMLTEFAPPIQWGIDLVTAGLLFLILGRRWALLPGLIVEAIPGMGVFPVWVLVVISLIVYDEIKVHRPAKPQVIS